MNSTAIHRDFQKMDFHNYVNKEISFVRSIDIMMYARGKTYTTEKLVEGCTQESGLGSTINVQMMIQ